MRDEEAVPNSVFVSGAIVLVLNFLIWGGAGGFGTFLWDFAGRASNCGPRVGVPCPEGTGYGLAGPWVALVAALALLAHLWREGVRGPMPAAVVPFVLGVVLGARFLWSAVFFADDSASRAVMAVVGVLLAALPGALYGRWLFGRWGAALLLRGVRLDRGGPVPASGPAQESARNALLVLSLTGAVLGCVGGVALV
ncbi:membrane protein [Streptomyces sp. NRRL WC-3753]|nr:membrane protein [Streptomyces sp. NRRL WC-3753]